MTKLVRLVSIIGFFVMNSSYAKGVQTDLTFVFPHIHYEKKWDIAYSSSLWSYFINNNLVEPLIRLNGRTNYQSAIAKSWFFSSDRKEITFVLNESYSFHDGKNISSQDIYKSILRVLRLKITAHSDLEKAICDSGECYKNIFLDGNKLNIKLKNPVNGILFNFATPEYGVVPSEYVQKKEVDKEDLKNLSGPYRLDSFEPKNIHLSAFKKHPYYSKDAPQHVVITEITDIHDSINYYEENVNVVLVGSEYSSAYRLNKLKGHKFLSSLALTEFIVPNRRSSVFKKDITLTKLNSALSYAKKHLDLDSHLTELTDQLFTKDNLARLDYSLETEPLKKLEHTVNLKMILFDWMKDSPVPYKLKEILKTLNIELTIDVKDIKDYPEIVEKREYDLLYIYSGVSALDPIVELIYLSKHPLIDLGYDNNNFLDKLDKAKFESNREKYILMLKEIHNIMLSEKRVIPLFHTRMLYITNSKFKIENMDYFDGGLDIWKWKQ